MKFLIISHVKHKQQNHRFYAYEPYVREMNIWFKYVDEVEIIAPLINGFKSEIEDQYNHKSIKFFTIPYIEFTSIINSIKSIFKLPIIIYYIFKASKRADHIHLRCPGNIGLLGCLVQICFPKKMKTAKYAGNWDPKAKQPLSYRIQKKILKNTLLTKNMQVLVYGDWQNQSENIKPFFTASFYEHEKEKLFQRNYKGPLKFVFIGSLVRGKRPDLAIKIIETLHNQGMDVTFDVFGDGNMKNNIERYIEENNLGAIIKLNGNLTLEDIKQVLKTSHFLILPSQSEGWPKAVTEAMFFGTIPIVTKISCVPYMLDKGKRGILIEPNKNMAVSTINEALNNKDLKTISKLASAWSQKFTLDYFESEIKKLLICS